MATDMPAPVAVTYEGDRKDQRRRSFLVPYNEFGRSGTPASALRKFPSRSHAEAIATVYADVTFEASGKYRGLASAIHGTTRGGRVVMVGLLPTGEQPVLMSLAITRELELTGALRFIDEIDDVIAALADGSLETEAAATHTFDVAD